MKSALRLIESSEMHPWPRLSSSCRGGKTQARWRYDWSTYCLNLFYPSQEKTHMWEMTRMMSLQQPPRASSWSLRTENTHTAALGRHNRNAKTAKVKLEKVFFFLSAWLTAKLGQCQCFPSIISKLSGMKKTSGILNSILRMCKSCDQSWEGRRMSQTKKKKNNNNLCGIFHANMLHGANKNRNRNIFQL